jgi:immune inhibitor A
MLGGSRRSVGLALIATVLFAVSAVSVAEAAWAAPDPMPLNPDVIERAKAQGVEIPLLRSEARFASHGGRRVNAPVRCDKRSNQTLKALVILVKFTDDPPGGPTTRYAPAIFDSMLFGRTYVRGGADPTTNRTLRNYYSEISYNTVDIVTLNLPSAVGWESAPNNYAYYCQADGTHDNGFGPYPRNVQRLVRDAVVAADPVVDFSQYAVDGVVRNLFVVHAGSGAEWNGAATLLWSHAWAIDAFDGWGRTPPPLYLDGVRISDYSMEPECGGNTTGEGGAVTGPFLPTVGVYAHEFGHVLGLPDEYDYGYQSQGTGRFSLMAGGSWAGKPSIPECNGNSPAHPSAWGVARLGFVTPTEVTGSLRGVQIPPIETTSVGALYRLTNPSSSGREYWLVENRQQIGFDEGFVRMTTDACGILIYHVDENVFDRSFWKPNDAECVSGGVYAGTNNCNCATLPANPTTGEKWYGLSVEQADGLYQMERNQSTGSWEDFYNTTTGKTAFSETTVPNTTSYYGCTTSITVSGISGATGTMTADLFGPTTCQVAPAGIDFGTVALGSTRDTILTITNAGGGVLSGTVAAACDQYTILSGGGAYSLGAGQAHAVTLRFAPASEGSHLCDVETGATGCGGAAVTGAGGALSAAGRESAFGPPTFGLAPGMPNPLNLGTELAYDLPVPCHVRLEIYGTQGQRLVTLVDSDQPAGRGSVFWNARDNGGVQAPSGVYFVRIQAGGYVGIERLILLR